MTQGLGLEVEGFKGRTALYDERLGSGNSIVKIGTTMCDLR